ncbi:phosphoribosylanthranilate isomerase [Mucilaginibacter hurinus]|uniref:N-(5'-phosphoribosyl)anthranilate isomerase n=1 Tax=Mucilaginibacter hurinus TaxID=2201324 RepID=A0A367GPY6_9SPHI|nr:phosphoribosylanthranilate isomerase [Mucilaginibacter hurinus]RCH55145.1 phosphoribosylanthranilate isomerase [Mucilaginibacter hurinus]
MIIKVCGMTEPANIKAVAGLSPDYLGFICYAPSPRFIGGLAVNELQAIDSNIIKTGVFVNEPAEQITRAIAHYGFKAIQLHGSETPELCAQFKGTVTVFKAFGVDEDFNFDVLLPYAGNVDYFLFDTKTASHGGSGKTFNWDILEKYKLDVPFLLSGGISADNIEDVKKIKHPRLYGVDLNSRFEISPGIKNVDLLKQAFKTIK